VWDEHGGVWAIDTKDGRRFRARAVVSGCGPLSRPSLPDIPGIASFEGQVFHSSRWDHAVPLDGKRVAVVGTGASGIQIIPRIAPLASQLTVYQRTAPWLMPKPDAPIPPYKRAIYARAPFVQQLTRTRIYWMRELLALGFVVEPRIMKLGEKISRRYVARHVKDPALRAKLTPDYRMGCKRVVPTNDYLPAIQRPNVELVTDGIAEVRAHSIVTNDGTERPVDALVLATGFEAAEQIAPFEVRGRDGRTLDEAWRDGPEAYLGTTVAGFPNSFLLIGPNTGLGHNSMVFMIESQIAYVLDALRTLKNESLKLVDVRSDVQRAYNARLAERLKGTVWMSGCMSWYLTRNGKNTTIWPGFTFEYRLRMRRFDARSYERVKLDASARRPSAGPPSGEPFGPSAGPQATSVAQAPATTTSSRSFTLT
jgi:cation diffusion facilitator CzcD-associated flavoprotein CzcO